MLHSVTAPCVTIRAMDENLTDDELLANLIADATQDVLARIGNDADARYQFFLAFIDLANKTVGRESSRVQ